MKTRNTIALTVVGTLAVVAALGFSGPDNRMIDRGMVEATFNTERPFTVSADDYRGVVQERAGYAFGLGHFVGKSHAIKVELEGWKDMVRELSSISAPNTLVARMNSAFQERLGYSVITDHLIAVNHGLKQERLGYGVVTDQLLSARDGLVQSQLGYDVQLSHQLARTRSLEQERMGLIYLLEQQAIGRRS